MTDGPTKTSARISSLVFYIKQVFYEVSLFLAHFSMSLSKTNDNDERRRSDRVGRGCIFDLSRVATPKYATSRNLNKKKTKPSNYSVKFHFVSTMFWSSRKWRHIDTAISAVFTLSFSTSTFPILAYDALPSHPHSELINSPRGVAFACFDLIMAWQIVGILHIYTWEAEVQGTTRQLSAMRNENTRQERQIIYFYCIEEGINVKLT